MSDRLQFLPNGVFHYFATEPNQIRGIIRVREHGQDVLAKKDIDVSAPTLLQQHLYGHGSIHNKLPADGSQETWWSV
jgi:hypothetical protein